MSRGLLNGVFQGYMANEDLELRRRAATRADDDAKVDRELRQEQLGEYRRTRDLSTARRDAMTQASTPEMDAATGVAKPINPYQAMEKAAVSRLTAGDLDGYNDLIGKSAAAKTFHYTTKVNNAYRNGDINSALEVLNEFPNGQKYSVQPGPGGKLIGRATADDGRELGQTVFNSSDDFFGFVQGRMNPGDISARLRAEADGRTKATLQQAQVDKENAQTGEIKAKTLTENATRDGKVGMQNANINQSNASAMSSRASAANAGTTAEMRNYGFASRLSPEQQEIFNNGRRGKGGADGVVKDPSVMAVENAVLKGYSDVTTRSMMSPEEQAYAKELIANARGAPSLVSKSSILKPQAQAVQPATQAGDPLSQARDAINKGAPRQAVVERLQKMGIDPKGL